MPDAIQVGGFGQASSGSVPLCAARQAALDPAPAMRESGVGTLPTHLTPSAGTFLTPWFCIHHRAHLGGRARRDLRRAGCEVHWPREIVRSRKSDDILRPIFPGYLFAQVPPGLHWRAAADQPDVVAVLGVREYGSPTPAPSGFVEALIDLAGAIDLPVDRTGDRGPPRLPKGSQVRIVDHEAFDGLTAIVAADDGGERVKVLLHLFGRSTPAELRRHHVRA